MKKGKLTILLILIGFATFAQRSGEVTDIGQNDPEETKEAGIYVNNRGEKTAVLYNLIIQNVMHFTGGPKVDGIQIDTSVAANDHELVTSLYVEKKIAAAALGGAEKDSIALRALRDTALNIRNDIPLALSELNEDSGHRTVTDNEKEYWNNKLGQEVDGSITNEIQQFDVSQLIGTDLQLSLSNDGEETKIIDLSPLQDGTGTDDQTAAEVGISDAGGYFNSSDVESALQELGANVSSGGDGWGSDVVHSGAAINGDGTSSSPLSIDTLNYIATKADIFAGLTEMDPIALSALADSSNALRNDIPCHISELICDSANRTVTDNEKAMWNNKLDVEADGSTTNELQTFDVAQLSGTELQLSLSNDGQETVTIDMSSLAGSQAQTAAQVDLVDEGGFYNSTNVEDALQEIGADISLSGDGWGTEVVNSTDLMNGEGTQDSPLTIDTNNYIATKADVQLAGNSYSPKVYLEKFTGGTDAQKIAAALNAIGSQERVLVFDARSYYTEGTVFPENVVVELPAGAVIEDFCTIRGGLVAPQGTKVFNSEVDLTKANLNRVYASWWGVKSRTTYDYTEELNNAIASFGQVVIDAGFVAVSNIVLDEGDWLYGAGDMHENTNSSNYTMLMPASDNCFMVEVIGKDCGIKDMVFSMTNPADPSKVAHTAIRNINNSGLIADNVKVQDGQGNNGSSVVDTCIAVVDSSSIYSTYRNFHVVDVDQHVQTYNSNQILFKDARFNVQTSALNNDPVYTIYLKDGRNLLFDNCGFDVSQAHHAMTTIYVDNPTSVRLVNSYVETVQHPDAYFMSIGSTNARTTVDIVGMHQDQVRNPLNYIFDIRDNVGGSLNIFGGIWNSAAKPVDYPGGNQNQPLSNLTVNFYGMVYGNKSYPSVLNYDSDKWDENVYAGKSISNTNFGLRNAESVSVNTIETELTEDDSHIPTSGAVMRAINMSTTSQATSGTGWIPYTPAVMWTGEAPKTNSIKAYYQVLNDKVEFFLQVDIETGSEAVTAVALTPPTTPPDTDIDIIISEDCYFDNTYPPTEGLFGYIDLTNDDAGYRLIRIPELKSEPGTEYDLKIAGWYPLNLAQ